MKNIEYMTALVTGGLIYGGIELLFRGFTHWSMLLTGGVCFLIFHIIFRSRSASMLVKCLASCGIITTLEFGVGCLVNLEFGMRIWDYSAHIFNLLGQICLLFSAIWFLMGVPMAIYSRFLFRVFGQRKSVNKNLS